MPDQLFSQHQDVFLMKKIKSRKTTKGEGAKPAAVPEKTNLPAYQGTSGILTKLSGHFKGCRSSIDISQAPVSA